MRRKEQTAVFGPFQNSAGGGDVSKGTPIRIRVLKDEEAR